MNLNNLSQFAELFIIKFLENGFGALPKRELEIYVMHLLLTDGQFKSEGQDIDFHEMSLVLKMTEAKVRNLIYEVDLKYEPQFNFKAELLSLIEKQKIVVDKDKDVIKFAIHSPLLKQAFEYEVRKLNGISDCCF